MPAAEPTAPEPEALPEIPPGRAGRDPWWTVGWWIIGGLFRLLFRVRFVGQANVPRDGGAILACNHISVLDPIPISLGATTSGTPVRFVTAAEFFRKPLIGWGLRRIRQIPIRRGASDRAALQRAARVLRGGALGGIFPEGTLSPDGRPL